MMQHWVKGAVTGLVLGTFISVIMLFALSKHAEDYPSVWPLIIILMIIGGIWTTVISRVTKNY